MIDQLPQLEDIWQSTLQWQPNQTQQQQFQQLYAQTLLGNQKLNLTRITAPEEFWEKHLWDSLAGLMKCRLTAEGSHPQAPPFQGAPHFPGYSIRETAGAGERMTPDTSTQAFKVIDIGTGAGFPGLPVAIAFPYWQIVLLDATRKKVAFLEMLVSELALNNVSTITGRAEAVGQQKRHREVYHLALTRAVGSVSVCAEYALPLLELDGLAVLYRGHWSEDESLALQSAVEALGGQIEAVYDFLTPLSHSVRHCIYLRKVAPTPAQYPRSVGVPTQHPL